MTFPSKAIVERVKTKYPMGTKVRLVQMDDPQAPPVGTEGEVLGVDDTLSSWSAWLTAPG